MAAQSNERQQAIETLRALINSMRVAMLTTTGTDGRLHSRPMMPARHDFDGDLWFFSLETAPLITEVQAHPAVNVAYVAPQQFISVCGTGEVVLDRKKMELLWKDELKSWFSEGLATANLVLLRIAVEEAEYWDEKGSRAGGLLGTILWKRTGQQVHEKVQWPEPAPLEKMDEGAFSASEVESPPELSTGPDSPDA